MGAQVAAGIGSVAAPIIAGAIGRGEAAGDLGQSRDAFNLGVQELLNIGMPPDLSQKIMYEKFVSAGIMKPELEAEILAGPSQVSLIKEDPKLKEAQMKSLAALEARGKAGFTPEERAQLNQVRLQAERDAEAKRQQIMQNFAARGQAGGSAELINQLQASQGSANQGAQQSLQASGLASQRALQAITSAGQLGGNIRGQDFDVERTKGSAADEMNRFNINNQLGTQQRNVSSKNLAQEKNLDMAQRLGEMNTAMNNQEALRQADAKRQYWLDQAERSRMRSGAYTGQSSYLQQQGDRTMAKWDKIGQGISEGLGGASSYFGKKGSKGGGQESMMAGESSSNAGMVTAWEGGQVGYNSGGQVPGQAMYNTDHPANDTVPARLSPGEIVVPKTLAESKMGKEILKLINAHNSFRNKISGNE